MFGSFGIYIFIIYYIIYWLVVWNINFIFPYIGNVIIPIDFRIFQRGGPTTNQNIIPILFYIIYYIIPRCSMYAIFTYIWAIIGQNVGKYSIHGASGFDIIYDIIYHLLYQSSKPQRSKSFQPEIRGPHQHQRSAMAIPRENHIIS